MRMRYVPKHWSVFHLKRLMSGDYIIDFIG